jgi:putative glutamine amidotransferase
MPPLIVISAPVRRADHAEQVRLNVAYARAIEQGGGLPVLVPPLLHADQAAHILHAADGLLLTGGEDVDPARYSAPRHPTVTGVSVERDATEIALLESAYNRRKPVLAICRGIQLMNVAFGGTLIQDIPSERPDAVPHDSDHSQRAARVHDVRVEAGTRLARALGVAELKVNSFHHQAPDRVGTPLRATAWSPDGIVEGLEWTDEDWWAVGVQWHPEELDGRWEAGLFAAFVSRAASRA